jgi:hypothetical protein
LLRGMVCLQGKKSESTDIGGRAHSRPSRKVFYAGGQFACFA